MSLDHNVDLPPTLRLCLEGFSLFGSGIIAGFTFYITAIELPAREEMPTMYQLENYHQLFPRARDFMQPFGMLISSFSAATAVLLKKNMWWIPTVLIGALGPYTAWKIAPTNKILMAAKKKDAVKVEKDLDRWEDLHAIRTYMSVLGFMAACAAALGVELPEIPK